MSEWINLIDEKKVFIDLFDIYEQELLTIFQYVAPITENIKLNVSSNKIHELHIRVCAECENLAKMIIKKYQYDESGKNMAFYIREINNHLWICDKKIRFTQSMDLELNNKVIQPFEPEKSSKITPSWWTNYNNIKHHKIENYSECWLWDVIYALWGYYILLNYLVLNIKHPIYKDSKINSKIFKPTIWWVNYPQNIMENYSLHRDDWELPYMQFKYIIQNGSKIITSSYWEREMKQLDPVIQEINSKRELCNIISWEKDVNLNDNNYLFYNSLMQDRYVKKEWWKETFSRLLKWETRFNVPTINC